jgi:hypothetical protein
MTIEATAIVAGRGAAWRASAVGAAIAGAALLLAPAVWNGYPLLQYDTGGYLARWYERYLVPSRSTVFGLYLHLGEGLHFWPQLLIQAACTLWIIALVLRITGVGTGLRTHVLFVTGLALATSLPFLASMLLTDIFTGLSILSLYLLAYHRGELGQMEQVGLFLLVAFGAASHSATLAVLLAVLVLAVPLSVAWGLRAWRGLLAGGAAIATGAAMLLAANLAFSGQLAWTPGGFGIAFGRLLQDGIVKRYLDDHCPGAGFKLCPYRGELPATADDFLWSYGVFNELGRFSGLGEEMREIVIGSLAEYPGQQLRTAVAATGEQLQLVASGYGVHDELWHTYGIVRRFIPGEVPAMQRARQQHGEFGFDLINRLHVPVAWGSMLLALLLMLRAPFSRRFDPVTALASTVTIAILANAFVCGALSGPHDRYGARIVWIATFVVAIAVARSPRFAMLFGDNPSDSSDALASRPGP